ncbi:MAG: hypothetical protein Tp125SUR00d2C35697761_31 [Prokaryotic dsDNA virus sp.]|nr:MAG: hypothetical protein Tp125SUR00d2C35697761_31 [Prokaryotic dsDNA virus sp.]QDP66039.1 MAG: hypothetical protein Unbinned4336contig1000_4 [Prokaryotic dsDNA virus sp.]
MIKHERRTVKQDSFHKWVATIVAIVVLAWGGLAYFVQAEDNKTRLELQSQINLLNSQQAVDMRVNELVFKIDKQLSNIESQLHRQNSLIEEVRKLRNEVNDLKVQLATRVKV